MSYCFGGYAQIKILVFRGDKQVHSQMLDFRHPRNQTELILSLLTHKSPRKLTLKGWRVELSRGWVIIQSGVAGDQEVHVAFCMRE